MEVWGSLLIIIADSFSIKELLRTLFYPWRRDIIKPIQPTLQTLFESWSLNLMSRLIGAFVRSGTIFAGLMTILIISVFMTVLVILVAILPILIIGSIIIALSTNLYSPIVLSLIIINLALLIYLIFSYFSDIKNNPLLSEPLVNALSRLSTGQEINLEPYLEFESILIVNLFKI
ncbi:MAG: hypothetical protein UR93_C0013G0015 [Berkelbacteria bacterium GW2011_GWA2_35_9]|uniref:Uncharacterized protein n=1 Tax=Berkelbacteria bacterium GW2011_GWA2_35_9 TaxID=1618333 RepID=A0A0G0FM17_9BACT|nr:MAG: hypothetical protein UR93_C0013G0015 [Berkelbacteria bacterium GW2011_GWA2_35_9]